MTSSKYLTLSLWLSFVLSFCLANAPSTFAQDFYVVDVLYPQVGRQGTAVDVTVEGSFLEHPEEVLFYQPGIRCTKLQPIDTQLDIQRGRLQKADPGRAVRLTFEIAEDAKPGEYQLRLRTRDNLSEMVTFWVTPLPVVMEEHAWVDESDSRNDTSEFAQLIPLNCTVAGYIPSHLPQDHDWYRVKCKKGQRLSVEVVAARLGTLHYGGMNDPAVSIFNRHGSEIGRNDDNALHTQDPVLTVVIPEDGTYSIHMHQQMDYEAARLRHYLMHVGTFARPLVAFPLGGRTGTTIPLTLLGDATGDLLMHRKLPTEMGVFEAAYVDVRHPQVGEGPWPNRVHVASCPDTFESPGHNSPAMAQAISDSLPVAINGRIESEGEVDWYRFRAQKGERYRVFAYGKTLDSELDPRVWIRPAPGNPSKRSYDEDDSRWEPHDLVGHHYREQIKDRLDPIFMFEPDADGEWLLGVGDTRRESGPRHIYRIEFQVHVDSAFVFLPDYPSQAEIVRDRIVLFPGHSFARPFGVQAGFGSRYDGSLQLRANNLPKGVTMEALPFTQNDGTIPVLFSAAQDAQLGAAAIDLVVEPVDPKAREHFRGGFVQVNPATQRRGGFAMYFNRTRKMALAVVEGSRFDIAIESPSIPLVRSGELNLKVKVRRHAGFDGAVYCEMDLPPPGVNKQPPLIIPAGETEGIYKLSAAGNAAVGEFPISITGRENEGGNVRTAAGFHYVAAPFVRLTVGEPYVTVKLARAAIERGKIGQMICQIEHHQPFNGKATLKLGRLPFGVEQVEPFPTINASNETATFRIKVTGDCLVGQYKDIFCDVIVSDGGQQIRQQSGNGVLRVDPERE